MPTMIAVLFALLPGAAFAHDIGAFASSGLEPWLEALMAASAAGYACGVARLWRRAGAGRGIGKGDVARFALGWASLAAALLSPLDALAARSFAIHMVQHEVLMVVAAPLIALSRPFEAFAWTLPPRARRAFASVAAGWQRLAAPPLAWSLHAAALWLWHIPALFIAALGSEGLHVFQHACFFGSALGFWWAVFGRGTRAAGATSIALLFTTMLHTGALGLLLAFSPSAWYARGESALFGLTALEDQQLGGLVMWVPGGLAYVEAGLAIVAAWLSPKERHATTRGPAAAV